MGSTEARAPDPYAIGIHLGPGSEVTDGAAYVLDLFQRNEAVALAVTFPEAAIVEAQHHVALAGKPLRHQRQ